MTKTLVGAHTSAAGGVFNALLEGRDIGATTIQLFTANQRRWDSKPLENSVIEKWHSTLKETGLTHIMSHDNYLINLGSANPDNLQKSRKAFYEEIVRCVELDITYLNFHPGAAVGGTVEQCLDVIVESLLNAQPLLKNSKTRLLLEMTAGQGSCVGWRFEEIAYILDRIKDHLPIGVCIDTCHIFVAGYDIRTPEACDSTLKEFDRVIGLKHLYAFHFNDSLKGLGSKVDRHADLGKGTIGLDCFKYLMNDPRTKGLPKYLETPGGPEHWINEIALLKQMVEK